MMFVLIFINLFSFSKTLNDTVDLLPSNEYCTHPDCSMENQHTMCIAADKSNPRLFVSGITPWMRYQLLLLHNRHRDNIAMGMEPGQPAAANMRKVYWDYELERMAEVWARQCQKRHDECRNTVRFNVLQNMDVRPVLRRVTEAQLLKDAVDSWFSGSRHTAPESVLSFRLGNCSAPGGCNENWYSTAAWASTWRLGCSQALCTVHRKSCVKYRKRRSSTNATTEKPKETTENVLLRIKYSQTQTPKVMKPLDMPEENESLIHRGMLDASRRKKTRPERMLLAYTVCNYGPAGNIPGFPIYMTGKPCSSCPTGTTCGDKTHRALCTFTSDPDFMHKDAGFS